MWAMIAVSVALAVWCAGLSWFHRREDVRRSIEGVNQSGSSEGVDEEHADQKDV